MTESENDRIIEQWRKDRELIKKSEEDFWSLEYPKLSKIEKIKTWERMIYWDYKNSNHQEDLSHFTPQKYEYMKCKDPNLEEIINEVIEGFNILIVGDDETKLEIRKRMKIDE